MKNSNTKKMALAIVATLLIIVLVFGATYAYWQWQTNTAQQTNVGFVITDDTQGFMGATFTGSGTITATSMEPSACSAAIKETITISYYNATPYDATVSVDLVATEFKIRNTSYKPTAANLKYLHWAITTSSSCTDPANSDSGRTSIANGSGISPATSDNFAEFADTFATTTSSITPTIATLSFTAAANSGTKESQLTKTYYLYVWLDKNYSHINTGSVNSDPMQGLSFKLQWKNALMEQNG